MRRKHPISGLHSHFVLKMQCFGDIQKKTLKYKHGYRMRDECDFTFVSTVFLPVDHFPCGVG